MAINRYPDIGYQQNNCKTYCFELTHYSCKNRNLKPDQEDTGFFLLNLRRTGGIVSPNKNPQGFSGSILSKITLRIATNGSAINIPAIPQIAPPAITAT